MHKDFRTIYISLNENVININIQIIIKKRALSYHDIDFTIQMTETRVTLKRPKNWRICINRPTDSSTISDSIMTNILFIFRKRC